MNRTLAKIAYAFITIFIALSSIFFIIRLTPGDPVETILGLKATPQEMQKLNHQLGLDLPLGTQYFNYLSKLIHGDMGQTIVGNKNVIELIKERITPTIILAFSSVSLSALLGIFMGTMAGHKKNKWFDKSSRLLSLLAMAFPIFSLAPILVYFFSIQLNWLPVSEWGDLAHIILPVLTLMIPLSASVMRVSRNKYLEEFQAPWVMVSRSKGLSDFAILLRILKVCLPTILNVVAIQLSVVIAGTMITETIYDIPGMGSLLFEGIQSRDYPLVQGVIAYSTLMYMVIYFSIDFINEKIDPRLQRSM